MSAANVAFRDKRQKFFDSLALSARVDIDERFKLRDAVLYVGAVFCQRFAEQVHSQRCERRRLLERRNELQAQRFIGRAIEWLQQSIQFKRAGRFNRGAQFIELRWRQLRFRKCISRGRANGDGRLGRK